MAMQIERIKKLTKNDFKQNYFNKKQPVIISSGLPWKAFEWTPNYLKSIYSDKMIDLDIIYTIHTKNKEFFKHSIVEKMLMGKAIEQICENKDLNIKHYLSQKSVYKDFPKLTPDFDKPIWMDDDIEFKENEINLWFGEAGNATPLHYDLSHNFLVQIYGKKFVRLFAPRDTEYLYRYTPQTGPFHLSQILDIDRLDNEKYPKFKHAVAYEGVLSPGESLFMPAAWWHDIRSIDHAISINFWWKPTTAECNLSELLPITAHELFENGRLGDLSNYYIDLDNFKNDLNAANHLIDKKTYYLAVLFMANFLIDNLKSISILLNIPITKTNRVEDIRHINNSILSIHKNLGIAESELCQWLVLITKTKAERNDLFQEKELMLMYNAMENFSLKIKKILSNLGYMSQTNKEEGKVMKLINE